MPRWTRDELLAFEASRKAAKLERRDANVMAGATAAHETITGAYGVHLVIRTTRPQDPDNVCEKQILDCLRHAEIIPDDRPQDIRLTCSQEKVHTTAEEEVLIEITGP